jgi:quercetin dioxygenase-like cupin family protein
MNKQSLEATARELLERARSGPGRAAVTVFGGHEHTLRQTAIALTSGTRMQEHESPGEATVQVLRGRVILESGQDSWEGRDGDLLVIPPARHALAAVEDSVVLLTVAKFAARQPG